MKRKEAIAKLRERLLQRREALRRALAGDLSALKELSRESVGDEMDIATDSAQDEMNSRLAEMESQELLKIEEALQRMRDGTYGICEVTGKPIPMERLQALPYATLCIEAQRELEQQQLRERNSLSGPWGGFGSSEPFGYEDQVSLGDVDY